MKIYSVGGSVRDGLLGIQSKDLDYVMVLDNTNISLQEGFTVMRNYMVSEGFEIFLETEEMVTIRARFPKNHKNSSQTADFVLARREMGYEEDTRRPILELGTLSDDLARRDFTINAMAEDEEGNIIDLFNGREHLKMGVLKTPQDPNVTFLDDPLRIIRALRFSITKNFRIDYDVRKAMGSSETIFKLMRVVSQERIREELTKMFKHDTIGTLRMLKDADDTFCSGILEVCFGEENWLLPTNKKK